MGSLLRGCCWDPGKVNDVSEQDAEGGDRDMWLDSEDILSIQLA